MLGAIIGDISGSIYEYSKMKTKQFELFDGGCSVTDDSIMTMAVFCALEKCNGFYDNLSVVTAREVVKWYRKYPNPTGAYGSSFEDWCQNCLSSGKIQSAYNSFGNGSAMRVSPVAYFARSLEECKDLAKKVTKITHNHPEGMKGAEAVAVAIYMALNGKNRKEIFDYINANYYVLDKNCNEIRKDYVFDTTCKGSVPQSLQAFFDSVSFEDAVKNAISFGGDADTLGAITGSVAEAYFGISKELENKAFDFLDENCATVAKRMIEKRNAISKSYLKSDGEMVKEDFSFPRSCGSDMDNFPYANSKNFRFTYKDDNYSEIGNRLKINKNGEVRKMTNLDFMFYVDEIKLFLHRRFNRKNIDVEEFYMQQFEDLAKEFYVDV